MEARKVVLEEREHVPVIDLTTVPMGEDIPESRSTSHLLGGFRFEDSVTSEVAEDLRVRLRHWFCVSLEEESSDVDAGFDGGLELPFDDISLLTIGSIVVEGKGVAFVCKDGERFTDVLGLLDNSTLDILVHHTTRSSSAKIASNSATRSSCVDSPTSVW